MIWKRRDLIRSLSAFLGGGVVTGMTGPRVEAAPAALGEYKDAPVERVTVEDPDAIKLSFDLVVVGGGIAGTSAAISAARNGVKVALVHERSMLGGNSSTEVKLYPENNSGHQPWIKEGGIHDEFHIEDRVRNHLAYREGTMNCHWDLVLYEWVIREPNITLLLNTHMHRVIMKNAAVIESVYCIQLGTEKSFLIHAPLFVDASGDGVLAHKAGAEYRWGREGQDEYGEALAPHKADEQLMGNTLFFRAIDTGKPVPFKRPDWAAEFPTEDDLPNRNHSQFEGGYWWIEVGAPYHPIQDNNAIVHEGLRQLLGVWDHIKNKGDHGAENYGLEFAGFWPYKRECRRILGDYVIKQQHIQNPEILPDTVAYGVWGIDIHVQGGILNRKEEPYPPPGRDDKWEAYGTMPYGIPLRALYSRNVSNLMMAGRPISGSYVAFASTRVLSTGSIVGEAVGVAASLCKEHGLKPREVAAKYAKECQQKLLRQGASIPGVVNEDPNDLARKARASASSEAPLLFPNSTTEYELKMPLGQVVPVSGRRIDTIELLLENRTGQDVELVLDVHEAAHVWDFREGRHLGRATSTIKAGAPHWAKFSVNVAAKPNRLAFFQLEIAPGVFWKMHQESDTAPWSPCPVGVTAASRPGPSRWRPYTQGRNFTMRLTPDSRPFSASNAIRGANRPDQWTNLWISDPDAGLPAWLELQWPRPVTFNTVEITFDTNMNRRVLLPLFRYPECVKDYRVEIPEGLGWRSLAEAKDNYFRRRTHVFDTVKSGRLRIAVDATNGLPSARIYEVRVYHESGRA
ncbi:MAG: hypothetical protein AMXMBFR84_31920 [Candidatus Hydrogenedentota bacterium]